LDAVLASIPAGDPHANQSRGDQTMKYCKDCKFYRETYFPVSGMQCMKWVGKPNPITGSEAAGIELTGFRLAVCGWEEAKYFEPRDVQE
jgi:hypothetical protein